jgi:hypothetical protein
VGNALESWNFIRLSSSRLNSQHLLSVVYLGWAVPVDWSEVTMAAVPVARHSASSSPVDRVREKAGVLVEAAVLFRQSF